MKIWMVMGTTGEYEDCITWRVAAYTTPKVAKYHMEQAQKEVDKYDIDNMTSSQMYDLKKKNPYDPRMVVDYTGVSYYIEDFELSEIKTIKEFKEHIFVEVL